MTVRECFITRPPSLRVPPISSLSWCSNKLEYCCSHCTTPHKRASRINSKSSALGTPRRWQQNARQRLNLTLGNEQTGCFISPSHTPTANLEKTAFPIVAYSVLPASGSILSPYPSRLLVLPWASPRHYRGHHHRGRHRSSSRLPGFSLC